MNDTGRFVEVQGTAEGVAFRREEMDAMLELAAKGISDIMAIQRACLAA
jgi:ribonuclease PH